MNIIKWDITVIMYCLLRSGITSMEGHTKVSPLCGAEGKVAMATDVEFRMCILDLCDLN